MKAVTLHQPWASLMADGAKTVETRHWKTRYRGLLAITAAKHFPAYGKAAALRSDFLSALRKNCGGQYYDDEFLKSFPLACVVAVVELHECQPSEYVRTLPQYEIELPFGNYADGRYGWRTRNLRRLTTPVPCSGFQRIWDLPPAVAAKVIDQL